MDNGGAMLVQFHGLRFDLPSGWTDITNDLPEGSPATLARPSGCGAIQFSLRGYRSGANPDVTAEHLRALLADFCSRKSLDPGDMEETTAGITTVGCVARAAGEIVAVWYLTNGRDIALVTYVSQVSGYAEELGQARDLVATIDF
jgi:hypothetical protein